MAGGAQRLAGGAQGLGIARRAGLVQLGGAQEYAMRIWIDRNALAARGLTVDDISSALRARNVDLPAGRLESTTHPPTSI